MLPAPGARVRDGDRARPSAPGGLRLDLLRAFVVLAEELHFTRAARRLFLSQSGLSRRITLLESTLGAALVVRTTREVRLTPAGAVFAHHAARVLGAADDAVDALRATRPGLRAVPPPGPAPRPGPGQRARRPA
jgi:DNA-binding transcriptional LysR family regulator